MFLALINADGCRFAAAIAFNGKVMSWSADATHAHRLDATEQKLARGYYAMNPPRGRLAFVDVDKLRALQQAAAEKAEAAAARAPLEAVGYECDGSVAPIGELSYAAQATGEQPDRP